MLATIVSQDPMYVVFPMAVRTALELRQHYADKGGFNAVVIKIRLPDGRLYGQTGKLDFHRQHGVRQHRHHHPARHHSQSAVRTTARSATAPTRELVDGEFVTVLLEGVEPVELLTVPRAAVLSDQQGDYVYTVDAQNKVQQRACSLASPRRRSPRCSAA